MYSKPENINPLPVIRFSPYLECKLVLQAKNLNPAIQTKQALGAKNLQTRLVRDEERFTYIPNTLILAKVIIL